MNQFETRLAYYMKHNNINGDHLMFKESCHSVAEAAQAAGTSPENFVKNICMVDDNGNLIVAIVKGEDRVSTKKIAKLLDIERPITATPNEILQKTGYPCGGVPSFGYDALFLIDTRVMEMETVYSGGGSQNSLIKISTKELQKANNARIMSIRK